MVKVQLLVWGCWIAGRPVWLQNGKEMSVEKNWSNCFVFREISFITSGQYVFSSQLSPLCVFTFSVLKWCLCLDVPNKHHMISVFELWFFYYQICHSIFSAALQIVGAYWTFDCIQRWMTCRRFLHGTNVKPTSCAIRARVGVKWSWSGAAVLKSSQYTHP